MKIIIYIHTCTYIYIHTYMHAYIRAYVIMYCSSFRSLLLFFVYFYFIIYDADKHIMFC